MAFVRKFLNLGKAAGPPLIAARKIISSKVLHWSRFVPAVAKSMVVGSGLLYFDYRLKIHRFDSTISRGNCTVDPKEDRFLHSHVVDRSSLIDDITAAFIGKEKHVYGVVLGPTGTGKSFAIKQACHQNPKGTLYYEIRGIHEFPRQLAETVGMVTEPSILGITIGWLFPRSIHGYYELPSEYGECLDFVIRELGNRAKEFAKKEGYTPCLFIDGADLLAKEDKRLFIKLVDVAKGYANEGGLRIVFGCSEGHIIPIIHAATSSNTRCQILEVLDLKESDALQYLTNWKVEREFAERLIQRIGTRMLFLERAVELLKKLQPMYSDEDTLMEEIIDELEVAFTNPGLDAVIKEAPLSTKVIHHLRKFDSKLGFDLYEYFQGYSTDEGKQEKMRETIQKPVKSNTVCYTRKGHITWHSRLVERQIKKKFFRLTQKSLVLAKNHMGRVI